MFLMLMALGSLAEHEDSAGGIDWVEKYARPAFSMFPEVAVTVNVTAVHCLILFRFYLSQAIMVLIYSLYFMWLIKPASSFNFINQASIKIQQIIYMFFLSPGNFNFV